VVHNTTPDLQDIKTKTTVWKTKTKTTACKTKTMNKTEFLVSDRSWDHITGCY